MGLDQYAAVKDENGEAQELAYWRKHNRLQGWMEELYARKGGETEFNCVDLELEIEDINDLETAIDNNSMPETEGFFLREAPYSEYEEYYKEDDLTFVSNARKALEEGRKVIYSCWW